MIEKWNEFRKIRGGLKKRLRSNYGLKKHYSSSEVCSCCRHVGLKDKYMMYAVAAYSSATSFYKYTNKADIRRNYKYKELRKELGVERIDVDSEYSNPTGFPQ